MSTACKPPLLASRRAMPVILLVLLHSFNVLDGDPSLHEATFSSSHSWGVCGATSRYFWGVSRSATPYPWVVSHAHPSSSWGGFLCPPSSNSWRSPSGSSCSNASPHSSGPSSTSHCHSAELLKLEPMKDAKTFLDSFEQIQFYLRMPDFSTGHAGWWQSRG